MFDLSDNVTHLLQLVIMSAVLVSILVFAPSIPPITVFSAFMPLASVLIGIKANQLSVAAANASVTPVVK